MILEISDFILTSLLENRIKIIPILSSWVVEIIANMPNIQIGILSIYKLMLLCILPSHYMFVS